MDFRRHVFAMTCNVTAGEKVAIGFAAPAGRRAGADAARLDRRLGEHFRREFVARLDRVVAFEPLALGDYEELSERRIDRLVAELSPRHTLAVDGDARRHLCEQALEQPHGARGFTAIFDRAVATPVLRLARGGAAQGTIHVRWDGERAVVS